MFECIICRYTFQDAPNLKEHVENEHGILIDLEKLTDFSEEDLFIRFLKSMDIASDYIEERMQFYPANWDTIKERIKFRLLAQKKLEICSKHIEANMQGNDWKIVRNQGQSCDY